MRLVDSASASGSASSAGARGDIEGDDDEDDDRYESDAFFRIGVQYAIDIGKRFAILPTLDFDLQVGDDRAVYGVRVAYGF